MGIQYTCLSFFGALSCALGLSCYGVPALSAEALLSYPLSGDWAPITRGFNEGTIEGDRCGYHLGEDIPRPAGTPVYPWAPGIVKYASDVPGIGHAIIIEHNINEEYYLSVYYHTKRVSDGGVSLSLGTVVNADDIIAHISGRASDYGTGSHLHFGIRAGAYNDYIGVDPRTGYWYFPGYTSIKGETEASELCDLSKEVHAEIVGEWKNPTDFLKSYGVQYRESATFKGGDTVSVTEDGVNVREQPGTDGTLPEKQSPEILGVIENGPEWVYPYSWWYVNFESGADGWVAEDFLRKVAGSGFALVDLGPGRAHAINDSGQIVGTNETNALYWETPYTTPVVLPTSGGTPVQAGAINELGQIVGTDRRGAVYWNSSKISAVFLGAYSATDINDSGEIVGYNSYDPQYWESSTSPSTDLNGNFAAATINNTGEIVGTNISGGNVFAVFWEDSTSPSTTLKTPTGAVRSQGFGINNAGEMAGEAILADDNWLPVFWPNSTSPPTILATLGGTYNHCGRINDAGKIVGVAQTFDGVNHAAVWDASTGSILNLNSVIPSGTGWFLKEARDINATGVIVGDGTLNGAARAFALVPTE